MHNLIIKINFELRKFLHAINKPPQRVEILLPKGENGHFANTYN